MKNSLSFVTLQMIDGFPTEVSVEVDVETLVQQYAERASKNAGRVVRLAHGNVVIRAHGNVVIRALTAGPRKD